MHVTIWTHLDVSTPENSTLLLLCSFSSLFPLLSHFFIPSGDDSFGCRVAPFFSTGSVFCFLLFWSADLILARMCLVARCSLSFSKSAFLGACYCFRNGSAGVCLCPCLFLSAEVREPLFFTSAHTNLPVCACMSKIAPFAANVNARRCNLPSPKTSYKASSSQNNAHSSSVWHRQLYKTKSAYTQRSHISNGTQGAIVPFLKTTLFIVVLTEH